jgi:acetolactate synthase regulatory subunit
MQAFHIHYRNSQGTLMRILTAVSRRALDLTYVHAEMGPDGQTAKVTLLLNVSPKQIGQLRRDWLAVVDVQDVRVTPIGTLVHHEWTGPVRPSSSTATEQAARAARA